MPVDKTEADRFSRAADATDNLGCFPRTELDHSARIDSADLPSADLQDSLFPEIRRNLGYAEVT